MGIDKSNVRFVIHRDMPPDIESMRGVKSNYVHGNFGREGVDGTVGVVRPRFSPRLVNHLGTFLGT